MPCECSEIQHDYFRKTSDLVFVVHRRQIGSSLCKCLACGRLFYVHSRVARCLGDAQRELFQGFSEESIF